MLEKMSGDRTVTAEAFCEEDEKGISSRAFYQSLGFLPGELTVSSGYPMQIFLLDLKSS